MFALHQTQLLSPTIYLKLVFSRVISVLSLPFTILKPMRLSLSPHQDARNLS